MALNFKIGFVSLKEKRKMVTGSSSVKKRAGFQSAEVEGQGWGGCMPGQTWLFDPSWETRRGTSPPPH